MITTITYTVELFGTTSTWVEKRSDFRNGEEPMHTGHKRKRRKVKWSKREYYRELYEVRPRCWKHQSKRRHQYRPVAA